MIESFDGLCGLIATFASSSNQIRCKYEFGHGGPCSFEKYKSQFTLQSCCNSGPIQHNSIIIIDDAGQLKTQR